MDGPGYCSNCGEALFIRDVEGRGLPACPRCEYIAWPDPKLVTAVVVEDGAGGIVLARRGIEPGYGLWCLPGGFVNDDEPPEESAVRECLEEIAAEVVAPELLGAFHIPPKPGRRGMVCLGYRARLAAGAAPAAAMETIEVATFAPLELPDLVFPSHRAVMREWRLRWEQSTQGGTR